MPPIRSKSFLNSLCLLAVLLGAPTNAQAKKTSVSLPTGFIYLRDIAPTILQNMRYASSNNFTGKRLPGYLAPECILRLEVAKALLQVQIVIEPTGYSLKVYDCYRPDRAVRAFARWARDLKNLETKDYYPRISKSSLFKRGYIARRSTHSRGSTIDLTLVRLPAASQPDFDPRAKRNACNAPNRAHGDNSVDMGTAFDCFDVLSHTDHRAINGAARANRHRLRQVMKRFGFANYHREWWHYSYKKGAYPRTYHDFPIVRRPAK